MSKRSECFFIFICAALVLTLGALLIFSPIESFSEKENRSLAGAPSFSARSFSSGDFLSELSDFCADQFPFREYLTDVKAKCEISLGKRENNGVFVTRSTLVDLYEYQSLNVLNQNLEALTSFAADQGANTSLLCAPRAMDVNAYALGLDNSFSQNALYSKIAECGISSTSVISPITHEQSVSGKAWYATDHHFSTRGAYVAYKMLMNDWNIEAYSEDFFDVCSASHTFLGSTYSKSGILNYTPDSIYLYRYANDDTFNVEYVYEGITENSFYDFSALESKDKYRVFLGGNFAHVRISKISEERPRLLMIKDSFANSVIPFLALHFDIDVIDPRYINEPIDTIVNVSDYDKILILCGADTLATDAGFGKWITNKTASR